MFNLFWRKKYQKNLELYKEYLRNDYNYVDYYKNRIKEIIRSTPYSEFKYKVLFNCVKDLEIYFFKDKDKYSTKIMTKVIVSADIFEHYNIFTDEYMMLSDNIRKSYRRSLKETFLMRENEYVKEMQDAYELYRYRIDNFLTNINERIR